MGSITHHLPLYLHQLQNTYCLPCLHLPPDSKQLPHMLQYTNLYSAYTHTHTLEEHICRSSPQHKSNEDLETSKTLEWFNSNSENYILQLKSYCRGKCYSLVTT